MKIETELNATDRSLLAEVTEGFVPSRVIDIHGHVLDPSGYAPTTLGPHLDGRTISPRSYRAAMDLLLPGGRLKEALLFPFPARQHDRPAANAWMYREIASLNASFVARGLAIVGPKDDPGPVAEAMTRGHCVGLKPYHSYAWAGDTTQAGIEDIAPEWMWRLCDRHGAVLMLHIMRDEAMSEPGNREALLRLSTKYPNCQLILAHVARSFNQRTVRGLGDLKHLANVHVDTSAICESENLRFALEVLGPSRVLYGSDYPISHLRGRCITAGRQFLWLYAEESKAPGMTLIGLESLLALRTACTQLGLTVEEISGIFFGNAQTVLGRFRR